MTKAAALHDSSNDSNSDSNSRLRQWHGLATLPRSPPPPPPPPPPNAPLYMVLYSVLNDRTRRHTVRWSGGRTPTCSAHGFSEARVRLCWRLSRSEHLHQYTSLYKCLILIFKRYGVNKHNLLTTSYFFNESGCEYSWTNWLSENIKSFKLLWFLWSIISTVVILI